MMKNILIIMSFMLLGIKAQAQFIVTIGKKYSFKGTLPEVIYFKDVNGILDKYEGVWEGEVEDNFYSFKITKQTGAPNEVIPSILEDRLVIHFKITKRNTGQVMYTKEDLPENYRIVYPIYNEITKNKYVVAYFGDTSEKIKCGDNGNMHLELKQNKKMKIYLDPRFRGAGIWTGENPCPDGRAFPPFLGEKNKPLVLTKK